MQLSQVTDNTPTASLCLFFYKAENFVEEAIESAFNQTYDDIEIILSDDCSPDRTFDIIKEKAAKYIGNKKIIINQNPHNLGLVKHVNKLIYELSSGKYVFLTAGDDFSSLNRVEDGVSILEKNSNFSAVSFNAVIIDANSNEIGFRGPKKEYVRSFRDKDYLIKTSMMAGESGVGFRREILNAFGPLNEDCPTEDSTLRFRSLLYGPIFCSEKTGLMYRIHDNNLSNPKRIYQLKTDCITKQYLRDLHLMKDKLSHKDYIILKRKISYYAKNREIDEILQTRQLNFIQRYYFNIRRRFLSKLYYNRIKDYIISGN